MNTKRFYKWAALVLVTWTCLQAQDTSLHMAVVEGDRDGVQSLIQGGADVNGRMPGGWTPLMVAIKYGKMQLANDLVNAKADVDAVNDVGNTALIVAVSAKRVEAVKLLLASNANVLHRNKDGMNAQEIAGLINAPDIFQLIQDYLNQKG